jgi:hypothetical protein
MVFAMQREWGVALPRAQRGNGGDIVKLWFKKAQVDDPVLCGTPMNLKNVWTNLPHKAKLFLLSPHNQENVVAPMRTVKDVTEQQQQQQQQQHENGANTAPCAATGGAVLPSDTTGGIVETTHDQGNTISLIYLQCMYKSSAPGTFGSINNCHIAIQAPSG